MVEGLEVAFGKQGDYNISPLPKRLHNSFNKLIETKGSADAEQITSFLDELVEHTKRTAPKPVFFDSMHLKSKSDMSSRYRVRLAAGGCRRGRTSLCLSASDCPGHVVAPGAVQAVPPAR
jgi:hypothetical protein